MIVVLYEFNFKVVYKLGQVYIVLDQLSKISHGELTIGLKDQLPNAILFTMGID
jgi:hypothetical protein